ncbi:hypothetical protein MIND_01225700 [Mycena indigotica]|uniref:DUF647-domain-containing protein n=1 Tax=Mycena indigotica TaxID=2126181 RepID=A0A8H6S648_9AGAR|nr:uncharacterized protein MIND_01225700 [Mycena indigotica]KAF7292000.1 hypothetical protein MIND_01225700 [Mycena indigotica]
MSGNLRFVERSDDGHIRRFQYRKSAEKRHTSSYVDERLPIPNTHLQVKELLSKVFLPSGYPNSVSPDYLRYQIFNALQAFCSSLAGLLSSRALLEGFGVGNPDASATHALLLTVLQDFFGRITTICAAYALGPSLGAEAKTFRFLADVANDAAIVLDTLSPLLLSRLKFPGTRVLALCLSGSLRAMCGICAGGSKAALAIHFSTPVSGSGDIGDLNAKDSSKETVLALFGMLAGSLIVPYLTSSRETYFVLFTLVGLHLLLNYLGVRGVVLRTLNKQRLSIAWNYFCDQLHAPSPAQVSYRERVLSWKFNALGDEGVTCSIGSSLASILSEDASVPSSLLRSMQHEAYVLWFDPVCLAPAQAAFRPDVPRSMIHMHICLREGYSSADVVKSWVHATEVERMISMDRRLSLSALVLDAHQKVNEHWSSFMEEMAEKGWETRETTLMIGMPRAVIDQLEVEEEDRKRR